MQRIFPPLSLALALLLPPVALAGSVHIHDAWIQAAPPGARVMAGYLQLENSGAIPITLDEVTSPDFERIELHRSVIVDDVARMEKQAEIVIGPGNTLTLQPGDYHLMLYDPRVPLQAGDTAALEFHFTGAAPIILQAVVRHGRERQHDHHHH